jgi:hypothetical protein
VPKLPTMSLLANHYIHCQQEMLLGEAVEGAALFAAPAGKVVEDIFNATLIDEIWASVKQRVEAHAMTSYHGLIAGLFK